jgi:hypothetical protein
MKAAFFVLLMAAAMAANGGMALKRSDGEVLSIDGKAYRLDYPESKEPRACDAVISSDGDKTALYLNYENRTWFERGQDPGCEEAMRRFGMDLRAKVEKPHLESHDEPADPIAGHPVVKRVVRITYSVVRAQNGSQIRSNVGATIILTAASDIAAVRKPDVHTGFPEIDRQLADTFSSLPGLVLAQTVSATEVYEGGKPFSEVRSWTTTSIEEKSHPQTLFKVPQGFVHQLPQYGGVVKQLAN